MARTSEDQGAEAGATRRSGRRSNDSSRILSTSMPLGTAAAGAGLVILGAAMGALSVAIAGLTIMALAPAIPPLLIRAGFVCFGLLFLFQNEAVPVTATFGFLVAFVLLSLQSLVWIVGSRHVRTPLGKRVLTPLLCAAGAFFVMPLLSSLHLLSGSVAPTAWLRDALQYFLVPMAILVGIEAALRLPWRQAFFLVVAASVLGAVANLTAWLSRRGGEDVQLTQIGVASSFTVFVGLALCLTIYFNDHKLRTWSLLGALVLVGLLLSTGGRQAAVYGVLAVIVALASSNAGPKQRIARLTAASIGGAATLALVLRLSESYGGGVAVRRLDFFSRIGTEGFSVIGQDASAIDRDNANTWVEQIWMANPLLGRGFGHLFPSVRTQVIAEGDFTLDTPLVVLAKVGVVGTLLLVMGCVLFFLGLANARKFAALRPLSAPTLAIVLAVLVLATVPNGFPLENRGAPVFVMLAIVACLATVDINGKSAVGVPIGASPSRNSASDRAETASAR